MKTSIAVTLAISGLTAGCANETTMVRKTVSPEDAALRDPSAHVLAIEHADGTRSRVRRDTEVFEGDRVVVEVPGQSADTAKGEVLVRYHPSKPMMIAGASLIGAGGGVAAMAAACKGSGFIGSAFCIADVIAAGTSLVVTGIGLLVAGSNPHPYIEHPTERPIVRVAPVFDAHGGGGVLQVTF